MDLCVWIHTHGGVSLQKSHLRSAAALSAGTWSAAQGWPLRHTFNNSPPPLWNYA